MAPVFFVGKKDSKKRMVQDYWYLNEWIIKNNYPLLLISDIVKNIGTKKMFTKLDLRWEYNNIWIKEEDEQKVAFTTLEGLFESTIMFFGLTNSLATFQTMKNKILWNLINTGKVVGFIDEIIVEFLNVMIGPEGIKIEEKKVKRLLDWLTSKEVKDIQKFLGLANYYQQFIKNFAAIARLLYDLVKKNQKWDWTEKQEKMFQELKKRFMKELVLMTLNLDKRRWKQIHQIM